MKKVDTEILEKMAKEKNIDKDKIEKITLRLNKTYLYMREKII